MYSLESVVSRAELIGKIEELKRQLKVKDQVIDGLMMKIMKDQNEK